jgi:hypothetical protein
MVTAILGYAQLAPLPKTSTRSPPRSAPLASTQPASSLTTLRFGQDCRSRPGGDARLRPRWRRRGRDRDRPPRPVRCRSHPDYRRSRRATNPLACLTSERRSLTDTRPKRKHTPWWRLRVDRFGAPQTGDMKLQPLPIRTKIYAGETVDSFARRAAMRNHTTVNAVETRLRHAGQLTSRSRSGNVRQQIWRQLGSLQASAF